MSTVTVDIRNPQINWQDVISEMQAGSDVMLVDGETPVARLTPVEQKKKRVAGLHRGAIAMTSDFDDPLPDEFWLGEE